MDQNTASLSQLQAQIDADPRVQQIRQIPTSRDRTTKLYQLGIRVPDGYYLDDMGHLQKKAPAWEKYVGPAIAATAGFGGEALSSALGPAAGAAGDGGLAASAGAPAATSAGILSTPAAAAGNAAFAAGGAASAIPWGTIAKVGAAASPLAVKGIQALTNNNPPNANGMALPPELSDLFKLQTQRIQQSQPLYDLMLKYAQGLAPQWARPSTGTPGAAPPMDPQMASIIQRLSGSGA